jgi:hypothetical protein
MHLRRQLSLFLNHLAIQASGPETGTQRTVFRLSACRAGLDFSKTFTTDLATGISAAAAHAHPSVAAGLSVGTLLVGKGVDSFNATYYYEKTFQALKSVITANRQEVRRQVFARQAKARETVNPVPYSVTEAISDIREYDDSCSIMSGLDKLVQVAGQQQTKEEQNKRNVQVAEDPVRRQQELTGTAVVPKAGASAAGK